MAAGAKGGGKETWLLAEPVFRKRLVAEPPRAVYALVGSERFIAAELTGAITERVLGKGAQESALVRIAGPTRKREAGSFQVAELLDELRSSSLFAERKVVVLDPAALAIESHRDLFADYLASPSPQNSLVLVLETLDGRTTFARRLKEVALGAECRPLYDRPSPWQRGKVPDHDSELTRWLVARAKSHQGCVMTLQAAFLLMDLVGNELGVLAGSLEKLAMMAAATKRIGEAEVVAVCASTNGQSSFDLAEAVLSRRRDESLRITRRVFANGLDLGDGKLERDAARGAPLIVSALRRGLLRFLRARRRIRQGTAPKDAIVAEGVNQFFADRALEQLREWPEHELHAALVQLADLEQRAKTGKQVSFPAELEGFLVATV